MPLPWQPDQSQARHLPWRGYLRWRHCPSQRKSTDDRICRAVHPKGPCNYTVFTWALKGSTYPYFGVYECSWGPRSQVYGISNNFQYEKVEGNNVMIVGSGAFAVENVRTCVEFRAKKVHLDRLSSYLEAHRT